MHKMKKFVLIIIILFSGIVFGNAYGNTSEAKDVNRMRPRHRVVYVQRYISRPVIYVIPRHHKRHHRRHIRKIVYIY
jgi:hypothetical protein